MTMASGVFGPTIRDVFDDTGLDVDFDNDTLKNVLVTDSYTPNFDTHDLYDDITNEVSGTGYTAGGKEAAGATWTIASGAATLDANDTAWTELTASSIRGRVLTDDTLSGDPLILATTFGTDYSVTNGTLTIQEHSSGLWVLDYTP